ncbi:N-acetyl sugar amidotransferase [Candidatus Uhrbacteria bacterium]|nr:N-acetyl sugar amidotransferase [Candidatus Uhrbacteria bacterium]
MMGLPQEVVFCKKCVISNQRPSSAVEFKHTAQSKKQTIGFDEGGVCSACRYQEMKEKEINWKQREEELLTLLVRHRSRDGSYDCVVPGSGGKDSAFTSHLLKYKYGMNPLTITWAPHLYTDIGWKNMQSWIHTGGFDNLLFTPNGRVHALLTRLAFENLLHPFQPFIIGQRHVGPRVAVKWNIPLVFYGENQAEYGNNIEENFSPVMKREFYAFDQTLDELFLGGVSAQELVDTKQVSVSDLNPYLPPKKGDVERTGVEVHYLGYYVKWDPQECFYYASTNTGFQPNQERTEGSYSKYSSIDDKIDPFHYYTTLIKFGIGRATYDAAQEIRNGKITREEGVALVRRFDAEFPQKYFQDFLNYLGITPEQFWNVVDRWRSPHLWKQENGEWVLRNQVT